MRTNPAFDKPLANRDSLSRYCYGHRSGKIPDEDNSYAFRVDGGEYSTILRLTPDRGEYNVYAYCYQREKLDKILSEIQRTRARAYTPVYRRAAAYARESGELEAWRASHRENIACCEAIAALSGESIPQSILDLPHKPILHTAKCAPQDMASVVLHG